MNETRERAKTILAQIEYVTLATIGPDGDPAPKTGPWGESHHDHPSDRRVRWHWQDAGCHRICPSLRRAVYCHPLDTGRFAGDGYGSLALDSNSGVGTLRAAKS